jgi:LysM repeat protein
VSRVSIIQTLLVVCFCFYSLAGPAQTYVVKSGDTLQKIAEDFYGSPSYDRLIVKHNGLATTKQVAEGTSLQLPDLNQVLFKEGLDPDLQDEIRKILASRYTYMTHRNELLRAIMPTKNINKIVVPIKIKDDLLKAANDIEVAAKSIAQKGNYYEAPVRMRRELLATAANMKKMAQGRYKKSYDESIHKNLATMFFHGIVWARDEEGNTKKLAH